VQPKTIPPIAEGLRLDNGSVPRREIRLDATSLEKLLITTGELGADAETGEAVPLLIFPGGPAVGDVSSASVDGATD